MFFKVQRTFCLHVKDYNDHWRPFWIHCRICSNQFDIIGKFETIDEDAALIQGVKDYRFAQLSFLVSDLAEIRGTQLAFPWANRKDTSENTSLSYFKLIDSERTQKLYDIFRLDFEMFNYSVIDYLNLFS